VNPTVLPLLDAMLRLVAGLILLLLVLHSVIQARLVWRHRRHRSRAVVPMAEPPTGWPGVDVVVPCYNEDPATLEACCGALEAASLAYKGELGVYLVDDGSPNIATLRPVYERYSSLAGWTVRLLPRNAGKRRAQDAVIHEGRGALVVTVDSDTVIARDSVEQLVRAFRHELGSPTGAVAGRVDVSNDADNLLTRLIASRYRVVYGWERPAQDVLGAVMCCSGPFTAYRRAALMAVWHMYTSQSFRGVSCTYGDDRHLANLLLANGYLSRYEPEARARTTVPTTLREYAKQQLRWNRSFYRELLWILPLLPRRSSYLALDVATRTLVPLLVGLVASVMIAIGIPSFLASGMVPESARLLAIIFLAQSLQNMCQSHDPSFSILYSILHAGLLFPVRLRALLTFTDNRWSTRMQEATESATTPRVPRARHVRVRALWGHAPTSTRRVPVASGADPPALAAEGPEGSRASAGNTPA
jgi:N-acetylglucosaminyltransferase